MGQDAVIVSLYENFNIYKNARSRFFLLPNASCYGTGMVYSNELIGSGGYVEV